jgi:hypothetical protein
VARFRFFERVLGRAGAIAGAARVLDVGSGDGWFTAELLAKTPSLAATCWDAGYTPALIAELAAAAPASMRFVAERPPEAHGLVLLLDVLEHVEDDRGFLADVVRENVASGGRVLFSVPAWQALYTSHDARLRHYRRYAPAEAARVLEGAGLEILTRGGLFHSLLPVRALGKLKERALGADEPADASLDWPHGPALGAAVDLLLRADNALSHRLAEAGMGVPGLTFWALCRKR